MSPDARSRPTSAGRRRARRLLAAIITLYLVAGVIGFVVGDLVGGRAVYGWVGVIVATLVIILGVAFSGAAIGLRRAPHPPPRSTATGHQAPEDMAPEILKTCGLCGLCGLTIYCLTLLIDYLILGHTRPTPAGAIASLAVTFVVVLTVVALRRHKAAKDR